MTNKKYTGQIREQFDQEKKLIVLFIDFGHFRFISIDSINMIDQFVSRINRGFINEKENWYDKIKIKNKSEGLNKKKWINILINKYINKYNYQKEKV